MDPVEILLADDADLNEFYGIKKIAPFRKSGKVEKDEAKFKKSKKKRIWEFKQKITAKQRELEEQRKSKKRKKDDKEEDVEMVEAVEEKVTSKAKNDKGVSDDRLASYSMPKKKKSKH